MDDLIVKYIVGETTEEEARHVQEWIASDEKHRKTYDHYMAIWEHSKSSERVPEPDLEAAWQRFVEKRTTAVRHADVPVRRSIVLKRPFRNMIGVAAAVLVMFAAWWAFIRKDNMSFETIAASETYTLPDQSVVTLNSRSRLWYEKSFNRKERQVAMTGEAFFDVAKNRQKPFLVRVDDIEVRVLGTSFNIRSDVSETEIVVESGSVKVSRGKDNYLLEPGDKLLFSGKGTKASVSRVNNQLYQYYRTNMFVCDGTPLSQLAESLGQAYGVKVRIGDQKLKAQQLTGKFPRTNTIEPILETVALTLNATVVKENDVYILK